MFEKMREEITVIQKLSSLKYFNLASRQRVLSTLEFMQTLASDAEICYLYVIEMEETNDILMSKVSNFINSTSEYAQEMRNSYENLQQELNQCRRTSQEEKSNLENMIKEMSEKTDRLNQEIIKKQEDVNELHFRIEEKQLMLQSLEKQSQEYLKNFQNQFFRQQKALQDSYVTIKKLEEALSRLQSQHNSNNLTNNQQKQERNDIIYIQNERVVEESSEMSEEGSQDASSIVKYSIISSSKSNQNVYDQFQQIKAARTISKDMNNSSLGQMELPLQGETLKEILNISLEKQYKMDSYKYDSVEGKHSKDKQNYPLNIMAITKSRDRRYRWIHNTPEQLLNIAEERSQIKEFVLPAKQTKNNGLNPYYTYFLIATQNVKIRSQYFQNISKIQNDEQWQMLLNDKIPLHEWESKIQRYLLQRAHLAI